MEPLWTRARKQSNQNKYQYINHGDEPNSLNTQGSIQQSHTRPWPTSEGHRPVVREGVGVQEDSGLRLQALLHIHHTLVLETRVVEVEVPAPTRVHQKTHISQCSQEHVLNWALTHSDRIMHLFIKYLPLRPANAVCHFEQCCLNIVLKTLRFWEGVYRKVLRHKKAFFSRCFRPKWVKGIGGRKDKYQDTKKHRTKNEWRHWIHEWKQLNV